VLNLDSNIFDRKLDPYARQLYEPQLQNFEYH